MSKNSSLRADAARNRERLIAVAREQFASQNSSVTLGEIAKLAGVGIGTLYRHFPVREALVEAVYRTELEAFMSDGKALLQGRTALVALRLWMDRYAQFVATKHAMYETLRAVLHAQPRPPLETRSKICEVVGLFLSAGVLDGTVRSDLKPDDLTVCLAAVLAATSLADRDQLKRILDLILDGLRPCV